MKNSLLNLDFTKNPGTRPMTKEELLEFKIYLEARVNELNNEIVQISDWLLMVEKSLSLVEATK